MKRVIPVDDAELTGSRPAGLGDDGSMAASLAPATLRRPRSPWRIAVLFVLPYMLLMTVWAFSNPPDAAPDESSHLVKALGMARLDIGTQYLGPPQGPGIGQLRNRSISRVIDVPVRLVAYGFDCAATRPDVSAACQPRAGADAAASVGIIDPLGSYPPFLYLPMGLLASTATTPATAFLLARLVCVLVCGGLLLVGCGHLVRWLGARVLLGAAAGLTPMVVFAGSIVSTSGMEICASFAVCAVVVAGMKCPQSLRRPATHYLLAGVGLVLVLSRQLGVVTFLLLMAVLVLSVGWRVMWDILASRRVSTIICAAILVLAGLAELWWELTFDHPIELGSPFSAAAFGSFAQGSFELVRSGVAKFGWLDTSVPPWFIGAWVLVLTVVVGFGVVLGGQGDRWVLFGWCVALVVVSFVSYATVFFPLGEALQGRDVLAMFMLLPVLAGAAVVERVDLLDRDAVSRLLISVGVLVAVLQFGCLYVNARRYAVGADGPVLFLRSARWHPVAGWWWWLALGLLGSIALGWNHIAIARASPARISQVVRVER